MNYWIKGGMLGIIFILLFSFVMTPILCSSVKQKTPQVSCKMVDQGDIFSRALINPYYPFLILFGIIAGGLIMRLFHLIKTRDELRIDELREKANLKKKPDNPWIWEPKKSL